jgi:hypothetical protein
MKITNKALALSITLAVLLACNVFTVKPTNWEGIPIMPNATEGEQVTPSSYDFTVNASADEAQNFYETELGKLGWNKLFVQEDEESKSIIMVFSKDSSTVECMFWSREDGTVHIKLIK